MDLQRLEGLARELVDSSLAPSTKRVYTSGQRRYLDFCKSKNLPPFPLSEDQLCTFVAHLYEEGLLHGTIKGYLSAIRYLQIIQGLGDPFTSSWPVLEYALRGVKLRQAKSRETRPQKRLPVTMDIMDKLRDFWSKEDKSYDSIMLWAASCMCFYGFLRSGEITVASMAEFDPEGHLGEGDVALDKLEDPAVVRVHIKASKTDPFRQGVFVFIGKTDNCRCPVAAIAAYLAVRGRSTGPFFRWKSGSPLSRETFVKHVRKALSASGMNVSGYSGHSFRIGAATAAAAAGLEDSMIKTLGRWRSSAYQTYVRIPRERLATVAKQLAKI